MDRSLALALGAVVGISLLVLAIRALDRSRIDRTKRGNAPAASMGGVLGAFDSVFNPAAARATEVREAENRLPAKAPLPGDPMFVGKPIVIRGPARPKSSPNPKGGSADAG